ncbi:MAG: hypothetical protein NTW50_05655 [Candidatus Berkelbacteria bacterium]|nr:hypothetical protein [Candidatus Berkelbacteria bacterium]
MKTEDPTIFERLFHRIIEEKDTLDRDTLYVLNRKYDASEVLQLYGEVIANKKYLLSDPSGFVHPLLRSPSSFSEFALPSIVNAEKGIKIWAKENKISLDPEK